jgi:PAS domain S-box-containing protein
LRDARDVFSRPPPSWVDGAEEEESALASQPQAADWLVENGPKELELLFRAIVFHPSVPILLADDDRHYLEASVGASKFLGLPREKIIGRSLGDFEAPSFKPVISERWRTFLKGRRAARNAPVSGSGRRPAGGRVLGQRQRVAGAPSFGAA